MLPWSGHRSSQSVVPTKKKRIKTNCQNNEIIIKQEPVEDEYIENNEEQIYLPEIKDEIYISSIKAEVKNEVEDASCVVDNYVQINPCFKHELKQEDLDGPSSSVATMCQVWIATNQEDEFYSENCKDEELDDPKKLSDYIPDIMPHFLSGGAENNHMAIPQVLNCHRCGEQCTTENYMEHIELKHRKKLKLVSAPKVQKKKVRYSSKYIYPCPYCKRSKTSLHELKVHIRTHTQEKPFKCPLCDYCANQLALIDRHVLLKHLTTNSFHCKICKHSTTSLKLLKRHEVTKHSRKREPRQCPFCDFVTCKNLNVLNRHIKKTHNSMKKQKENNDIHKIEESHVYKNNREYISGFIN